MSENSRVLNRVFSQRVLNDLLRSGTSNVFNSVIDNYVEDFSGKSYSQLFKEIYSHLEDQQRNEYYYINTLLNKLLMGVHNVNTTTVLSKIHIGKSIADIVMINGECKVYALEVKSELDSFDRLYSQILNYYKVFSKVSVLSAERDIEKVKKTLASFGSIGDSVGIYTLSSNNKIFRKAFIKEPRQMDSFISHIDIFKVLRKSEYTSVVYRYYGELPQTTPVTHFRIYLDLFRNIPILDAQRMAFAELKKRSKIDKETFRSIQPELKSVIYFSNLYKRMNAIDNMLQAQYRR